MNSQAKQRNPEDPKNDSSVISPIKKYRWLKNLVIDTSKEGICLSWKRLYERSFLISIILDANQSSLLANQSSYFTFILSSIILHANQSFYFSFSLPFKLNLRCTIYFLQSKTLMPYLASYQGKGAGKGISISI